MHATRSSQYGARRDPLWLAVAALALFATACGASGDTSTSPGVASLEDVAVAVEADPADADSPADGEAAPDEAALEFSACMREQGLDFPDIGLDSNGNPDLRSAFDEVERGSDEFSEASQECRPILENAGFGGGGRAAIADNVEIQDALVEFSDCVRDDGWDVGDLTLGGPGQGGQGGQAGGGEGGGGRGNQAGGERGPGFGNPTNRFAVGLGLDPEDPEVQATVEKCAPIIEEAFTNAGVGPGRGNN